MLETEQRLIGEVMAEAADRFATRPFLVVPEDRSRNYYPNGRNLTYEDVGACVTRWQVALQRAGYGHGHRIAVLLENRPSTLIVKLACNVIGASWVPINPDYRAGEIGYLLADSEADLVICTSDKLQLLHDGRALSGRSCPVAEIAGDGEQPQQLPRSQRPPPHSTPVHPLTEASLLYTSGTTGRPKGCRLAHEYELMMGAWYASRGGRLALRTDDRVYSPLPLFHVNTGIILFYGMLVTGNCQIIPERFSRSRWWREIIATGATGMHYLGVVIPVLMNQPPGPQDRAHNLRWGLGAGVEPTLHGAFEARFGVPLVEVWGMTEMCRILTDCHEPRQVGTRAMGRPQPGLEVRVVDEHDRDVPAGQAGEMVVRHSAETPRKGAFSGYLNHGEATEHAWRGGWFHTGDTVRQDATGMVYFIDRKKNIIRRSGENIAAAEVEAVLQAHARVAQVAVLAIDDELRDEEVMACIVCADEMGSAGLASELFDHCFAEMAYFKAPGWIVFVDELPVTGTQKVLKHIIFQDGEDPRTRALCFDLRERKTRGGQRRDSPSSDVSN